MNEPSKFRAGDTVTWDVDNSDYPASTYALKYYIRGASKLDVTATTNGTGHRVTITAAETALLPAGTYTYQGRFEAGAAAYTPEGMVGSFQILPNLATLAAGVDARTHARVVLEAVEAMIEGRATKAQQAMSIAGRQISYIPLTELLVFRSQYKAEVSREEAAEKVAKGLNSGKSIVFAMRSTS